MVSPNHLELFAVIGVLVGFLSQSIVGQNCGCAADQCCSQFGYCGTSSDYCGLGCRSGPCSSLSTNNKTCEEARKDPATFACQVNTNCTNLNNNAGYRCTCSKGYTGNPYVSPGCVECEDEKNGTCTKNAEPPNNNNDNQASSPKNAEPPYNNNSNQASSPKNAGQFPKLQVII
ncbi:hypothetical protein MKW92_050820, partial [Papaver armeniacum]